MKNTYLVYAKRTPIGKFGGALASVRPDDLLAILFKDFASSMDFDLKEISDVIVGCANQAGEDNRNVARMSAVLGGIPYEVPAVTVNRLCGSSLDAVIDASCRISAGLADCVLVGGVESMTRGPFVISKASTPYGRDSQMFDTSFGWRFENPKMKEMFPLMSMGETAEEVATLKNINREDQDKFALTSHQRAVLAWDAGHFKDEVVPVEIIQKKNSHIVDKDEGPRGDTSLEKLAKLGAVFRKGGTVTPGNASSLNDGASCVFVVSEEFLRRHSLKPMVEITGAGVAGLHPNIMGLGPVEATKRLCARFGKKVSDFDVVELNEAFAAQSLGCLRDLEIDPEITNLRGGAIALGHPLGCSGARILTTLTHIMKDNPRFKEGLASMCIGVGQGVSLSVRRC